jgi:hypothetical protein
MEVIWPLGNDLLTLQPDCATHSGQKYHQKLILMG